MSDEFNERISREGLEDMLEEATERLESQAAEIKSLEKALSEELSRTDLFTSCLNRALKIYQDAHPEHEGWPSGDVNLAWVIGGFKTARILAGYAQALLDKHQQEENGAVWGTGKTVAVYEVANEHSRDVALEELAYYLQQWDILYGVKKNTAKEPQA